MYHHPSPLPIRKEIILALKYIGPSNKNKLTQGNMDMVGVLYIKFHELSIYTCLYTESNLKA
jgi:hypothetical protein